MNKIRRHLIYEHAMQLMQDSKLSTLAAMWEAAGGVFCEYNMDPFRVTDSYPELEQYMDTDLPVQERWDDITLEHIKFAFVETMEDVED